MTKKDFEFIEITGDTMGVHKDYWYRTNTVVNRYLADKYVESVSANVPAVIYAKTNDDVAIVVEINGKKTVVMNDDEELHGILKELSDEVENER